MHDVQLRLPGVGELNCPVQRTITSPTQISCKKDFPGRVFGPFVHFRTPDCSMDFQSLTQDRASPTGINGASGSPRVGCQMNNTRPAPAATSISRVRTQTLPPP